MPKMTLKAILIINFTFWGSWASAQLAPIGTPSIPSPEHSIYISVDGEDSNDGTMHNPVANFQKAMQLIPFNTTGDVYAEIVYLSGDYYPEMPIRQSLNHYQSGAKFKHISVRGEGIVNIYGDNTGQGNHLLYLRGSGIKVENINLHRSKGIGILIANYNSNGVLTNNSKITNVLIKDVSIDETFSHGMITILIDTILIDHVLITKAAQENTDINGNCQWGSALRTKYCTSVTVRNCTVFQNRGEGINIATCTNALVESNVSYDNFAANIYCIRTNKAIFRRNLVYNRDSIYWRNCQANQVGTPQERKPSAGFSVANEVNYDDFFSNACTPERSYENGIFSNKLADSIFFYNNILILAPLRITDESYGNCLFPQFSHANNFSNIFIENNTFIGDISTTNDYLNKRPLIGLSFDQAYFWGCFPNVNGVGKFRVDNIVFQNNIISLSEGPESDTISPLSVFYGGRPCNGGPLKDHFASIGNTWHHNLSPIYDAYVMKSIPNFMLGADNILNGEMLTMCDPETELDALIPNSMDNLNHFYKTNNFSAYIDVDYFGNPRDPVNKMLTNIGAIETKQETAIDMEETGIHGIHVYPNPTKDVVFILSEGAPFEEIYIYNSFGIQQILETQRKDQHSLKIDLSRQTSGFYYLLLVRDSKHEVLKVLKI